jgi:hypothetical protein|tara:strand:+ start:437 stop:655 length:219 start_codon:yes stop_codon:yes gene_type:complete
MGYAIMMSPCLTCGKIFGYNPHLVPSISVNGERHPVCLPCIVEENRRRQLVGQELLGDPRPGAYEPIQESEL